MSWDCYLVFEECSVCKHSPNSIDVRNVTYNNSRIFSALGVHPDDLKGKTGKEVMEILKAAFDESYREPTATKLLELEPGNGWGGVKDSQDFIYKLYVACYDNPEAKVHFS